MAWRLVNLLSSSGLTPEDQAKLDALPKLYFAIKDDGDVAISISTDSNAATAFTGLEIDQITALEGWQIEAAHGAMRNISGKTVDGTFGAVSFHLASSNASSRIIYVFSETSTDNGVTWVKNEDSAREESWSGLETRNFTLSSQFFNIPDQGMIRFRIYSSGTGITAEQVSLTADGETIVGPAYRLWHKEM